MTTIFYETFSVARLTFNNEWRLDYDPSWKERRSAFPVCSPCCSVQDRSPPKGCCPGSPIFSRKRTLLKSASG
jgi:hypothetical protein